MILACVRERPGDNHAFSCLPRRWPNVRTGSPPRRQGTVLWTVGLQVAHITCTACQLTRARSTREADCAGSRRRTSCSACRAGCVPGAAQAAARLKGSSRPSCARSVAMPRSAARSAAAANGAPTSRKPSWSRKLSTSPSDSPALGGQPTSWRPCWSPCCVRSAPDWLQPPRHTCRGGHVNVTHAWRSSRDCFRTQGACGVQCGSHAMRLTHSHRHPDAQMKGGRASRRRGPAEAERAGARRSARRRWRCTRGAAARAGRTRPAAGTGSPAR